MYKDIEIDRKFFKALFKTSYGYYITLDGLIIDRFYKKSDKEAIEYFRKGLKK